MAARHGAPPTGSMRLLEGCTIRHAPASRAFDGARRLVSKKKRRLQEGGYDLDLSYVTDRIVAMGFPCTGLEAVFRNPRDEVKRFFAERHQGHFKVYNLCSERVYCLQGVFPVVEHFPFNDHNPCPFQMLLGLLDSVSQHLAQHEKNIVAVHCKAGKGRTGLVVAALLLHLGICESAFEALEMFSERRTWDCLGVTIPSQIRYVQYYGRFLRSHRGTADSTVPRPLQLHVTFQLHGVRLITVPNFGSLPGMGRLTPYFKVIVARRGKKSDDCWMEDKVFCWRRALAEEGRELKSFEAAAGRAEMDCSRHKVRITGDVLIKIYAAHHVKPGRKICQAWLNTSFVREGHRLLHFGKERIDMAHKDSKCRHFSPDFALQLHLRSVGADKEEARPSASAAEAWGPCEYSEEESSHGFLEDGIHDAVCACATLFPMCAARAATAHEVLEDSADELSVDAEEEEVPRRQRHGEPDMVKAESPLDRGHTGSPAAMFASEGAEVELADSPLVARRRDRAVTLASSAEARSCGGELQMGRSVPRRATAPVLGSHGHGHSHGHRHGQPRGQPAMEHTASEGANTATSSSNVDASEDEDSDSSEG